MSAPDSDQVGDVLTTQQRRHDGFQQRTLGLRYGLRVGRLAHRPYEVALFIDAGHWLNVGALHPLPFWTHAGGWLEPFRPQLRRTSQYLDDISSNPLERSLAYVI